MDEGYQSNFRLYLFFTTKKHILFSFFESINAIETSSGKLSTHKRLSRLFQDTSDPVTITKKSRNEGESSSDQQQHPVDVVATVDGCTRKLLSWNVGGIRAWIKVSASICV